MSNFVKKSAVLAVAVALLAFAAPVQAGYINMGDGPAAQDFTLLGTAWDPGVNTGRVGGNPAPGGATWSIIAAGTGDSLFDPHGGAATSFAAILATVPGGVDAVLNLWAAPSGFSNLGSQVDGGGVIGATDAAGGVPGDIRIGAYFIDGAIGPNVLAHAFQPFTSAMGANGSAGGDVHFDNGNTWSDEVANFGTGIDTFTVMLHELGHSLGLGHSAVVGSIMEPIYAGVRRTLHADDIAGIIAIYGPGATDPGGPGPDPIPEPGLLALLGIAVLGFAVRRKRTA